MNAAEPLEILRANSSGRADARLLQRRCARGELVRLRQGAYVERPRWQELDGAGRSLVLIRAVATDLPLDAELSHDSAAVVLGVPRLTQWPERVHATVSSLAGDVHRTGLTLHAGTSTSVGQRYAGVAVASLCPTVVETARRAGFAGAVVALDHALRHGVDETALRARARAVGPWGAARVQTALAVCDVRHESVGESYTAAVLHEIGAPPVEPQHVFDRAGRGGDRVDFWMPSEGAVIEFDGRQEYQDPAMLRGRSGADALWAEKRREDRLRGRTGVRTVIRVTWWHLVQPDRLRALLREHGVRCR